MEFMTQVVNFAPLLVLGLLLGTGLLYMCWRLVQHWDRMEKK